MAIPMATSVKRSSQDHQQDSPGLGAERNPNADLTSALNNHEVDDGVEPNGRDERSEQAQDRGERCHQSLLTQRIVDARVHRLHVKERHRRIQRANLLLNDRQDQTRVAHRSGVQGHRALSAERKIHRRERRFLHVQILGVLDETNDLDRWRVLVFHGQIACQSDLPLRRTTATPLRSRWRLAHPPGDRIR